MIKKILALSLMALLCGTAVAGEFSKVGTSGAQFLKIGVGSRYNAMGEAAAPTATDIYAMYWNPAGLSQIGGKEVAFAHVSYITDISLNYVAYAQNFEDIGTFGVSATILSMGEQEITGVDQDQQNGTGQFYSASSYAFQVSFARYLTTQFAFGASVKYVGEEIYREKSAGVAFDFGTMLHTGWRTLRIGMNISNMGPELKFDGPDLDVAYDPDQNQNPNNDNFNSRLKVEGYSLPLTFRVGLAYDVQFGPESNLLLAAEAKHPNDHEQQGALGAEYSWDEKYFLRSGYKFNYDEEAFSFGGGLKTGLTENTRLTLDYAWVDFGRLESVHKFSASVSF